MLSINQFEYLYNGSSFPVLVTASDHRKYVMKMKGSGNGIRSLLQEFIVNRTCSFLGFPVPDVRLIQIPEGFPWTFGTDEFDDIVQRSFGINLGIEYIDGAVPLTHEDSLNSETAAMLSAIDIFFCNFDRISKNSNLLKDRGGGVWITDHGSCEFLNQSDIVRGTSFPVNHFLRGKPEDYTKYMNLFSRFNFTPVIEELPEEWTAGLLPEISVYDSLEQRKQIFL